MAASVTKLLPARRRVRLLAITVDKRVTSPAIALEKPRPRPATSAGKRVTFLGIAPMLVLTAAEVEAIPVVVVEEAAPRNATAAAK